MASVAGMQEGDHTNHTSLRDFQSYKAQCL